MQIKEYIKFLNRIEKLKRTLRHSWSSDGRQESVAEHSWRLAIMALLCKDEYPSVNIEKVIKMCLLHDLGESVTGDIPAFKKTMQDEESEQIAVISIIRELPDPYNHEFNELFAEMNTLQTDEAKLFKALDNMEALISHNEAPLNTWLENEYIDNLIYGQENVMWSPWTQALKDEIKKESILKIQQEKPKSE